MIMMMSILKARMTWIRVAGAKKQTSPKAQRTRGIESLNFIEFFNPIKELQNLSHTSARLCLVVGEKNLNQLKQIQPTCWNPESPNCHFESDDIKNRCQNICKH